MSTPVVLYEQEYEQLKRVITRLCADANAKFVFLVDKNGQQIAAHGEMLNLDTTSLASLTAGNVAATDGLAHLIGERGFLVRNQLLDHILDRERCGEEVAERHDFAVGYLHVLVRGGPVGVRRSDRDGRAAT